MAFACRSWICCEPVSEESEGTHACSLVTEHPDRGEHPAKAVQDRKGLAP